MNYNDLSLKELISPVQIAVLIVVILLYIYRNQIRDFINRTGIPKNRTVWDNYITQLDGTFRTEDAQEIEKSTGRGLYLFDGVPNMSPSLVYKFIPTGAPDTDEMGIPIPFVIDDLWDTRATSMTPAQLNDKINTAYSQLDLIITAIDNFDRTNIPANFPAEFGSFITKFRPTAVYLKSLLPQKSDV